MKPARLSRMISSATMAALTLSMLSACGQPVRPNSASDFCLNDRRISVSVAGAAGVDDPGNTFDTDATVREVLAHNEVHDRVCANR